MKRDTIHLLYHGKHKRPMPGFLPLFFLLAVLLVVGVISLVRVVTPQPLHPRGVGNVYYRNDELTRFQVRQRSALPLRLPAYADPAAQLPIPSHDLAPLRRVQPAAALPLPLVREPADSALPEVDHLLDLPPAAAAAPEAGEEVQP